MDFGSKLAGTTAICFSQNDELHVFQSSKGKDADRFILEFADEYPGSTLYIDAPLSLPSVYSGEGDNYFFRECDKSLKAMSPMFIGGLTARAMRIKDVLEKKGHSVIETYPGYLARNVLNLSSIYSKSSKTTIEPFVVKMEEMLPLKISLPPENWHQVDAILSWYSGYRHLQGTNLQVGDIDEGVIIL